MISIVLPSFNGERYLSESIDSILSQDYKDWELIIVDDCSTDGTKRIADEYAKKDNRIRVIHNQINKKLPASLNIGFDLARGEYLTWTSDDNVYYEDGLRVLIDYLEQNKEKMMVCTGMDLIDESGTPCGRYPEYNKERMYYNACVGACFLYRRQVLKDVGKYDETLFGIEDYDYWLRIQEKYGEIGFVESIHYGYRVHDGSLTSTKWIGIKQKLNKFRQNRFDMMFDELKNNKKYLSGLFFDMLITDSCTSEMIQRFEEALPNLKLVGNHLEEDNKIIVYGAGDFGNKAYHLLGDKVSYYADRNIELAGTLKNGVEIISVEKLIEIGKDYTVLVALESCLVYEVAMWLIDNGITRVTTLQSAIQKKGVGKTGLEM